MVVEDTKRRMEVVQEWPMEGLRMELVGVLGKQRRTVLVMDGRKAPRLMKEIYRYVALGQPD